MSWQRLLEREQRTAPRDLMSPPRPWAQLRLAAKEAQPVGPHHAQEKGQAQSCKAITPASASEPQQSSWSRSRPCSACAAAVERGQAHGPQPLVSFDATLGFGERKRLSNTPVFFLILMGWCLPRPSPFLDLPGPPAPSCPILSPEVPRLDSAPVVLLSARVPSGGLREGPVVLGEVGNGPPSYSGGGRDGGPSAGRSGCAPEWLEAVASRPD